MFKDFKKNKKLFYGLISLLFFVTVLFSVIFFVSVDTKSSILEDSFWAKQALHSWRSLEKLPDILFAPFWFKSKQLPVYNLSVDPKNIILMNNALPDDIIDGHLQEENKVFVSAYFNYGDYADKVKIRYSGADSNHWDSFKKSLMIKFPKENLFQGISSLRLIIPYDRMYFIEPLNVYRAEKFGLPIPKFSFVNLKINNIDYGVYLMFEQWTKGWLEKNKYIDTTNVFKLDDEMWEKEPLFDKKNPFSLSAVNYWKSYTDEDTRGFEELKTLFSVLSEEDDELFKRQIGNILDLEKFYYWDIINVLADSVHQSDYFNLIFLFNKITGKFEIIPWDVAIGQSNNEEFSYKLETTIAKRVLSIPEFREKRNNLLNNYLEDKNNLNDDLNYYDSLYGATKYDFFSDKVKRFSNFSFVSSVHEFRQYVVENFETAKKRANLVDYNYDQLLDGTKEFSGSFEFFEDTSRDINSFLRENYQFYRWDNETVALSAGNHVFRKNVIIPVGLKLIIDSGAQLFFDKNISLISHGAVSANGTSFLPIKFKPLYPGDKWGVFGVINAPEKSIFRNIYVSGGSEFVVNGAVFTSQLSINNSDALIENSVFEESKSDDGLHIIKGKIEVLNNIFRNNQTDAMDLDFTEGVVGNNIFSDSLGDCLDLSGSIVEISGNSINNCADKGISVGEQSFPNIQNNAISRCGIGIAVKDKSEAYLKDNKITDNNIGVALYQKKQIFGGANVWSISDLINNNELNIEVDGFSNFYEE